MFICYINIFLCIYMGFDFGIVDFFINYMYIVFNFYFLEDVYLLCMIVYCVYDLFVVCFDNCFCIL